MITELKANAQGADHAQLSEKTKFTSPFKRIARYLQQQAQEQSHSTLYLSPSRPEPQQHHKDIVKYNSKRTPPIAEMTSNTTGGSTTDHSIFRHMTRLQYASDNILQSYDVLVPPRPNDHERLSDGKYWIVFIHGGYFRDIKVTSASLKPAISLIESSPSTLATPTSSPAHTAPQLASVTSKSNPKDPKSLQAAISGYASLNYRLSPHPSNPQSPSTTPSYTFNNAHYPDHLDDILSALSHLQSHHPSSHNYILVGHSVGATLAFLAALNLALPNANIAPPCAIVGVSGIYDFPRIHTTNPDYEEVTRNAMDPGQYSEASPALYDLEKYLQRWGRTDRDGETGVVKEQMTTKAKRVVVLAHSRDDGLVGWDQVEEMEKVFAAQGPSQEESIEAEILELSGRHDEIWQEGTELVRAIEKAVEVLLAGGREQARE